MLAVKTLDFLAAAQPPDALAARIALYITVLIGLAWVWKRMLVPASKVLARTVKALEALEGLPAYRRRTDRRLYRVEKRIRWIDNALTAILRELGIEDKVRRMYSTPGWEATEGMPDGGVPATWRDLEDIEGELEALDAERDDQPE